MEDPKIYLQFTFFLSVKQTTYTIVILQMNRLSVFIIFAILALLHAANTTTTTNNCQDCEESDHQEVRLLSIKDALLKILGVRQRFEAEDLSPLEEVTQQEESEEDLDMGIDFDDLT